MKNMNTWSAMFHHKTKRIPGLICASGRTNRNPACIAPSATQKMGSYLVTTTLPAMYAMKCIIDHKVAVLKKGDIFLYGVVSPVTPDKEYIIQVDRADNAYAVNVYENGVLTPFVPKEIVSHYPMLMDLICGLADKTYGVPYADKFAEIVEYMVQNKKTKDLNQEFLFCDYLYTNRQYYDVSDKDLFDFMIDAPKDTEWEAVDMMGTTWDEVIKSLPMEKSASANNSQTSSPSNTASQNSAQQSQSSHYEGEYSIGYDWSVWDDIGATCARDFVPLNVTLDHVPECVIDLAKWLREVADDPTASDQKNFGFTGPSGSGKTTAMQQLALLLDCPWIPTVITPDRTETKLFGDFAPEEGSGNFKMLQTNLSKLIVRGGIHELQEMNNGDPDSLTRLNSLLDSCARVELANGETVRRNKHFFFGMTCNPAGQGYGRQDLDLSLINRFLIYEMDYPDAAIRADMVVKESGVDSQTAATMVEIADKLNLLCTEEDVNATVSIRNLILWGKMIRLGKSPYAAALPTIVGPCFFNEKDYADVAEQTIKAYFNS